MNIPDFQFLFRKFSQIIWQINADFSFEIFTMKLFQFYPSQIFYKKIIEIDWNCVKISERKQIFPY